MPEQRRAARPLRASPQPGHLQQGRQNLPEDPERLPGALLLGLVGARQLRTGVLGHRRRSPVSALHGLPGELVDQ
ncbi:hypothetical protein [Streptomyces sp. NPDC096323]|uniref:hypothetical protein n=1 Tax=Streptomyces sp. NPDC096323 TaxID=3155822 RepID=UPI00331F55EB